MDILSVLAIILTFTTAAAVAGVGLLYGSLQGLRADNADLRDRVILHREARTEAEAKAAQVQVDLEALGRVVRGQAHWTNLEDSVRDDVMPALQTIGRDIKLLIDTLTEDDPS